MWFLGLFLLLFFYKFFFLGLVSFIKHHIVVSNSLVQLLVVMLGFCVEMNYWLDLFFLFSAGPGGVQEEVAEVAPAEVHGLRHQISAPVDRQQQQLQHPDHHADAVQPQNAPGLVLLHRRPVLHMSPMGGSHKCETLTCKTLEEAKEHKWLKKRDKRLSFIYIRHCWRMT